MKKTTKISIILLVAASITVSGILIFDPNINKNGNVFSHAVVDEDNCPLPLGHTPIKELVTKNYVDQSVIFRGAVTRILGDNNDGNFYFYVQDGAYAIECFSQEAASFAINDVVDVAGVIDKLYSYVACTTTSVSVVETTTPKVIIPYEVTTFSDFEALTLIDSGRLVTVKDMIFVSDNRDANRNGEIEFSLENNDLFVTVYSSFLFEADNNTVNAFVNNLTTTSHVSYTGIYLDYDDGSYDLQLTMPSDLSLVDSEHTSDMSIDYNHSATNNTAITLQTSWFTYQGVDVVSVDASTIYASTSSEEFRIGTSSNNGFVRFNFAAATNITSIELFGRRWASDATTVVAKTSGFTSSAVTWGTKTSHIYTLDDATATYLEISATKRFLFESIRITFGTEVHVPVTNVAFELISLTLGVNATKQLGWTVFPSNATDQGVSFMSLDSTIAAVNATGLITASNVGTTSIIVTTNEGGFTDTIDITVVASSVTGVSFALTELEVSVGADGYLAYTVMPEEAVNKTVTMTSDNPDVFDVDDDGFYLAFDAGEATVTVRTVEGGYTDTIAITVIPAVQSGYYQANNLSSLTNTFISKNSAYAQGRSGSGQGLDPVLPSRGDAKMLIIPVDFANYRISDPTTFRSNLNKLFFGTPSETGWESVKSFYETSSYGKLTMSGLVTPVWSLTQRTSDIVDLDDIQYNYSLVGAGEKTTDDLIYEVSGFLTAQGIDGRDYDVDQDGHLDSVWFIYSCPIQYQNNGAFWAYVFSSNNPSRLTTPSLSKPTGWRYAWASYDFMFEGNYSGNKVDAHTFIHETGHLMGVEDYYDYSSQGVDYVACADMMSYNIGDHNVFTKFQLGWVNPYVIDGTKTSTTITLESTPSSGDCILIKNTTGGNYWNNSPYDEYLLLEFYTPTLLNQADSQGYAGRPGLKTYTTSGIKLYHVDARVYGWLGSGYGFTDTAVDGGSYYLAMSNTYNGTISSSSHPLLELIPQNKTTAFRNGSYTNSNVGSSALLFTNGTSFSVDTYQNFFLSRKLYDGTTLGYSFTVNAINGNNTATVVISKV